MKGCVLLAVFAAAAAPCLARMSLLTDRTTYLTSDPAALSRPLYLIYDAPANTEVRWSATRDGRPVEPGSALDDPEFHGRTDASGRWYGRGPAWRPGKDVGLWTREARVGAETATAWFYVADRLAASPANPKANLGVAAWGGLCPGSEPSSQLLDAARVIRELGARGIFFAMSSRYAERDYPGLHVEPRPSSLTALAQSEPFRAVLDLPFRQYVIAAYTFANPDPLLKMDPSAEAREFREFAEYILKKYRGSGKTFVLKNWEGDGAIAQAKAGANVPVPEAAARMISWLTVRHRALDEARRNAGENTGVTVRDAVEFNSLDAFRRGEPSVLGDVVPKVPSDYVSYSAYDSLYRWPNAELRRRILDDLALIRRLPMVRGRPLLIGEFGFSERDPAPGAPKTKFTAADVAGRARIMAAAFLEGGAAHETYWQVCDTKGRDAGFGLLRPDGARSPVWSGLAGTLGGAAGRTGRR